MKRKLQVFVITSILLFSSCGNEQEEEKLYGMSSEEIEELFGSVPEFPTLTYSGSEDYKGFALEDEASSDDFVSACQDRAYDSESYGVQFDYDHYRLDGVTVKPDYCLGFASNVSIYKDEYAIKELIDVKFLNVRRFHIFYYDRNTEKETTLNVMEFLDSKLPNYEIARYSQTTNLNVEQLYLRSGRISPIKVVEIDGRKYLQILLVNKEETIDMRRDETKKYYVEGSDGKSIVPVEKVYTTYYDLENGEFFMEDAVVYKYADEKLEDGEIGQSEFTEDNLMYASLLTTNLADLTALSRTRFDIYENIKPQCDIRFEDEFNYKCSDLSDYEIVGDDTYNIVQHLTGVTRDRDPAIRDMGFLDYLKEDNPKRYAELENGGSETSAFNAVIYIKDSIPFEEALSFLIDKDLDINYYGWEMFGAYSIDGDGHQLRSWDDYYKWIKPEYLPKEEDRFYGE